jgi:hypothetical protein
MAVSKMSFRFALLLLITVFGMGSGLLGCGGSGGSNSTSVSGTFTLDSANPGTNTISLSGTTSGDDLDITVNAKAVSGSIFGAAFDLAFNPDVLTYVGYSVGNFFEQAGSVTYAVSAQTGRLIVGVAAGHPGNGASDTGAVVTFHFKAKATGTSVVAFENQALCSSASIASCDRQPSLSWYGGTYSFS